MRYIASSKRSILKVISNAHFKLLGKITPMQTRSSQKSSTMNKKWARRKQWRRTKPQYIIHCCWRFYWVGRVNILSKRHAIQVMHVVDSPKNPYQSPELEVNFVHHDTLGILSSINKRWIVFHLIERYSSKMVER